jgi:tetratricopeptide (TPR) repeat protein
MSRVALCLATVGVASALAGLWWTAARRADVNFLPEMTPARWIAYPVIPAADAHPRLELSTVFENSFVLGAVPSTALLRIAGSHRYTITVNGIPADKPLRAGASWKQPDTSDVSGQLRTGINRIEITVFNADGPPALWLSLGAGPLQLNSGDDWRASYAGAAWHAAVPASAPRPMTDGSSGYRLPKPLGALAVRWPAFLGFALLSAAGCWLLRRTTFSPAPDSDSARPRTNAGWGLVRGETFLITVLIGFWLILFVHNIVAWPHLAGFDVKSHVDYIRHIQEHNSLPAASQGWEMFQPPLYYLLSAAWLKLLHLSVSDASGITALRCLGLAIGVAHLLVIRAALRLLFPAERSKAGWGFLLAACLPAMLYLSQYITNEPFAAMLVSGCVLLTLRALKQEQLTWKSCVGLGLCLGAALLAKSTALLVLPPVFGSLLWKQLEKRTMATAQWAARIGLIASLCALVGGWHYARLWIQYGNPLTSNMSPGIGFSWWQDDGYRTSAFYLRFGAVLLNPWTSTFQGYWDAFYATLWGDGLLSGGADFFSRPPWNYDLMAAGYWFSLLPTLAVLAGIILAVVRFIRRPSAEWLLLLGFSGTVLWALAHMSLVVPAQVKAIYGLSALVPFCAIGALGSDLLTQRSRFLRSVFCVGFGLWAINSCASFWISRSSVPSAVQHACALVRNDQFADASDFLKEQLRSKPGNADLQFSLAYILTTTGRVDEGARLAETMVRDHPDDCRGHHVLALAFAQRQQPGRFIDELRQVLALAPGYDPSWGTLAPLLFAQGHPDETISLTRQALAAAPFSAELRMALGSALLLKDQVAEAEPQFRDACLLDSHCAETVAGLAWKLATDSNPIARDGTLAVKLAELACILTANHRTIHEIILAAAYAEAARYPEAVKTAEQARTSAQADGDSTGVALTGQLIELFKTGQPYRETPRSSDKP